MENITVAVHQPNYLPWSGYFYKMLNANIFVFLDDVHFSKNSYINRNKIKGPQGAQWLTVPVKASIHKVINEIGFSDSRWSAKHLKTMDACYKKAPYYQWFRQPLAEILETPFATISELNKALIIQIAKWLDISCEFRSSSELKVTGSSDDRIIDIVKKVGGSVYLSGRGGGNYQDAQKFLNAGIVLKYYDFSPQVYSQLWGDFQSGLSIIDLLFNTGPDAVNILRRCHPSTGGFDVNVDR
jgi:hypothetical protein